MLVACKAFTAEATNENDFFLCSALLTFHRVSRQVLMTSRELNPTTTAENQAMAEKICIINYNSQMK